MYVATREKWFSLTFRDMFGIVQCIVIPSHTEASALAKEIRPEWVLRIEGKVNKRPEKNINPNVPSGDVELEVMAIEVLNKSENSSIRT